MIAQLTGQVVASGTGWAVIDVNGLGLRFSCPPATAAGLGLGDTATVFTSLLVRQDAVALFGFSTAGERDLFELVQTATGVGSKLALAIVSVLTPAQLRTAVLTGDVQTLCQVPGVGAKSAQRLVIELKDRVQRLVITDAAEATPQATPEWRVQVAAGLEGLGWSAKDAQGACDRVAVLREQDPTVPVATLLRAALQSLARA